MDLQKQKKIFSPFNALFYFNKTLLMQILCVKLIADIYIYTIV
jgi:hypothetical protein